MTSEDKTGRCIGGGGSVLIPVRGDVHNSMMSMAERLHVVGAHQLRSVILRKLCEAQLRRSIPQHTLDMSMVLAYEPTYIRPKLHDHSPSSRARYSVQRTSLLH